VFGAVLKSICYYQNSLVKLLVCVKSYELQEGSTVIEVKVANTGHAWKFGFCRDMSLALEILDLSNSTK
jgi:hypothetical protein